jgi:hypothetical protein
VVDCPGAHLSVELKLEFINIFDVVVFDISYSSKKLSCFGTSGQLTYYNFLVLLFLSNLTFYNIFPSICVFLFTVE